MKNNRSLAVWIAGGLSILPIFYLAAIYPSLPAIVPTHFDMEGRANDYSEKSTLILFTAFFTILSFGCFLLITNLPKIDPKKTAGQSPELFQNLGFILCLLFTFINFFIIYAATNQSGNITKVLLPALGIFFSFIGYYMREIKPNYFAGFRTPWALEDPDNWKMTHLLAGKFWIVGGALTTILTLVLPDKYGLIAFISIMAIITIIPFAFSFLYFKKQQQK